MIHAQYFCDAEDLKHPDNEADHHAGKYDLCFSSVCLVPAFFQTFV